MIIDTPSGEIETIEKTLDEYAMVFTGQMPPESFLNDPFEIMALKNKLEITKLELRQAKELYEIASNKDRQRIDSLETQVNNLFSLIGHSLHRESKSHVPLTVSVPVTVNTNDHLAQSTIHQHGQSNKIMDNKISITNHNEQANIANLVNNPQDSVTIKAEQFSQTSGTNTAELLQIIANLRQITTQFPQQNQDDIIIDLDDIEQEFQKPQQERNIPKIKKRLIAIAAAVLAIARPIAAIADFTNNITDLANKADIELQLPSAPKNPVF
jgi:internalin A